MENRYQITRYIQFRLVKRAREKKKEKKKKSIDLVRSCWCVAVAASEADAALFAI